MAMVASEFRMYIGISNCTFTDGLHPVITACIPEFNPWDKGWIGEKKYYQASTTDPLGAGTDGSSVVAKVKTVICTYWGHEGRNQIIPCVHRGDRVLVFNYGGSEEYYWKLWGRDPGLHKHERVRWFAMDKCEPSVDDPPKYADVLDTNTYFIEMNTNPGDKGFRVHTCDHDGEAHVYDMAIFPEKSMFEITDNMTSGDKMSKDTDVDKGNCFRLMSDLHKWRWRNVDDSYIELDKENITIWCKNNITIRAGNDITVFAGNNFSSVISNERKEMVGARSEFTCPEQQVTGGTRKVSMQGYHYLSATGVTQIAYTAMSLKGGACALSFQTITHTGKHYFTGGDFFVGTAKGCIPTVILFGSNAWGG